LKVLHRRGKMAQVHADRLLAVNTLDAGGRPQFIHSGTYEELTEAFGLSSSALARSIAKRLDVDH